MGRVGSCLRRNDGEGWRRNDEGGGAGMTERGAGMRGGGAGMRGMTWGIEAGMRGGHGRRLRLVNFHPPT